MPFVLCYCPVHFSCKAQLNFLGVTITDDMVNLPVLDFIPFPVRLVCFNE